MPTSPPKDVEAVALLEEELDVTKVAREREHLRVTTRVETVPTTVEATTREEHISITRVPKNVDVEALLPVRYEGDTMVISLVEEVAVVTTKLVLKEEIRITKQYSEKAVTLPVSLRREYADIERETKK